MVKLPEMDRIDYLMQRRFPSVQSIMSSKSSGRTYWVPDRPGLGRELEAHQTELAALTPEELEARYTTERAKAEEEEGELEEGKLWFHQPTARADFEHWAKAVHWTLDEAIALSFGKAPEAVSWVRLEVFAPTSPFTFQYRRRRDLALRAGLFDPVLPGFFLAWAKRNDFPMPPELEAAVAARGVQIADWKTRYDELRATSEEQSADLTALYDQLKATSEQQTSMYDELNAMSDKREEDWTAALAEKDELIERLAAQIQSLHEQIAMPPVEKEKSLSARERESLLKLVIGMALEGYKYNPKAARSEHPAEIASDLEKAGVSLDVDTVRKWLREAAELLPSSSTK